MSAAETVRVTVDGREVHVLACWHAGRFEEPFSYPTAGTPCALLAEHPVVAIPEALTARFPDEPLKGTTYYAVMRSLQMKFMRLPKSQVRIGQRLPENYR